MNFPDLKSDCRKHGRRALLVERVRGASVQERVGDYPGNVDVRPPRPATTAAPCVPDTAVSLSDLPEVNRLRL